MCPAVGAIGENAVDSVAKCAGVTNNFSLQFLLSIAPDGAGFPLHLHAKPNTEAVPGPVVEFQRLQILQDGTGYSVHDNRFSVFELSMGCESSGRIFMPAIRTPRCCGAL